MIMIKEYKYSSKRRRKISEGTKRAMADPAIRKKISLAKTGKPSLRKGKTHTEEAKKKMSLSSMGQEAWNKGRTDLPSPSQKTIEKRKLKMMGKDNPAWMGNKVGYGGVHNWIRNKFGKANKCENTNCTKESKTFEWANISGKYKRDIEDYFQLCRSCHRRFDYGSLTLAVIKG